MAVEAEEAGMDAFMEKPFRLEELTAVYIKLLERENRNQRVVSAVQPILTSGLDTGTLGAVPRGSTSRSIRNITKNAKIFVDASEFEFDDAIASQVGVNTSELAQDGTSPNVAVPMAGSQGEISVENQTTGSGSGRKTTAKVHITN